MSAAGLDAITPARKDLPAGAYLDQWLAVVMGLMGLDDVHGGDSELHPVHVLAIREAETPDPGNDAWAFFARNWGDEGECSSRQHYVTARPSRSSFRRLSPFGAWTTPWTKPG